LRATTSVPPLECTLALLSAPAGLHDPPSFPTRRSSDLHRARGVNGPHRVVRPRDLLLIGVHVRTVAQQIDQVDVGELVLNRPNLDRKSTRLNSSHVKISYAVFCLKKKKAVS